MTAEPPATAEPGDHTHGANVSSGPIDPHGPEALCRDLKAAFRLTLRTAGDPTPLLVQAWDSFEGNVAIQAEGQAPIACRKGCPSCCTLRVSASTPEVLVIAHYLRTTHTAWQAHGIDLIAALRQADATTRGLDEAQRVARPTRCPFLLDGVCAIHRVRPLACRGHASHDRSACESAAAGQRVSIPFSGPHRAVRLVVQSALLAALRAEGLAWGSHELNHATVLALDQAEAAPHWLQGEDPLSASAIDDEQRPAMAQWLDAL